MVKQGTLQLGYSIILVKNTGERFGSKFTDNEVRALKKITEIVVETYNEKLKEESIDAALH